MALIVVWTANFTTKDCHIQVVVVVRVMTLQACHVYLEFPQVSSQSLRRALLAWKVFSNSSSLQKEIIFSLIFLLSYLIVLTCQSRCHLDTLFYENSQQVKFNHTNAAEHFRKRCNLFRVMFTLGFLMGQSVYFRLFNKS